MIGLATAINLILLNFQNIIGRILFGVAISGLLLASCQHGTDISLSPHESEWVPIVKTATLKSTAGAPSIIIQRSFGGAGDDYAYDIWSSPNSGFIITGSTEIEKTGDLDLVILKVDENGELIWTKKFGGPNLEIGFGVRTLRDGTIVVAGWTQSFGAGEGDFYLLGLTQSGKLKFEKTYGSAGEERATSLVATEDGGAIIIGESYGFASGDSRFYVVKIDPDGNLEWEKTYDGGPLNERGLAIVNAGEGFLLVGNAMDATSGSLASVSDGFVVRIDRSGNSLWRQKYGGEAHDIFHHVASLGNDKYLLTGYTRGFSAEGENDIWLVTIDGDGKVLDTKLVGGLGADHSIMARTTPDGSVYLCGYTHSRGLGGWDAQIIRRAGDGEIKWDHAYGSARDDGAAAIYPMSDGNLALVGFTEQPEGDLDILFYRVKSRN